MDYQLNILGEFRNKDNENEFMLDEVRKNLNLIRYMILFSCLVLMDTSLREAEELAKRLKEQLTFIEHKGMNQTITCSFGVTAFAEGDSVQSIIQRADQLLYLAKEYGKNKVVAG